MCCQESGEREATVTLSCPKAPPGSPKVQKVGSSEFVEKNFINFLRFSGFVFADCDKSAGRLHVSAMYFRRRGLYFTSRNGRIH
jgi:hypothetical protein